MSFKPIDPKRDEIRRYLERGSVLDSLTKIFIRLIKERPENPMDYIRNNIGMVRHQHDKYERLSLDLQEANEEIKRLRAIINSINPEALQGQGSLAPIESEESESATVAEKAAETTEPEKPKNGAEENVAVAAVKAEELAKAVENCHIEESNVAEEPKKVESGSQSQSLSVQAEPSSTTDNTE